MGRKCRAEHQNLTVCFWKCLSSLRMAFPRCRLVPRAQNCSRILGATVRTECRNFFPVRRPCPGPLLNTAAEQAGPREPRPVSVLSVSPVPCRLCGRRSHVRGERAGGDRSRRGGLRWGEQRGRRGVWRKRGTKCQKSNVFETPRETVFRRVRGTVRK